MTRAEIEAKLVSIIQQEKPVAAELLKPETALTDAGIDSLDSLTILFAIEEQFGVTISDERSRAIRTFGDMIDAIAEVVPAT